MNFFTQITVGLTLFSSLVIGAQLDLKKSSLKWHGSKITGKHHGQIFFKDGKIQTENGKIKNGFFTVDMSSFTVTDLKGDTAKKFLGHMKSSDFFEVEKFPTAKLDITKVNGQTIMGNLTVKGKTNPVKFDYKKSKDAYVGTLKFDRTKFGIKYGSGSFFDNLGDKAIDDEVKLNFKLVSK